MASELLVHDIALLSLTTYNKKNKWNYLKTLATEEHVTDEELEELIQKGMYGEGIPKELMPEWNMYQGRLFEGYIAQELKKNYNFISWTSDKSVNGVMAPSASNPDLAFSLFAAKEKKFAVECKWHNLNEKNNQKNKVRFVQTENKLVKYIKYQNDNKIPCFIAVGYGRTGTDLSEIYIIPLNYIMKHKTNATNISKYLIKEYRVTDFHKKIQIIEEYL